MMVVCIKFICRVHGAMIIDLLANPTMLRPYWLLLNTHLTPNYNNDLDVIMVAHVRIDHVNYFSTSILSLILMVFVGGS